MKLLITGLIFSGIALLGCAYDQDEPETPDMEADTLLKNYLQEFSRCRHQWTKAEWQAAISGRKQDFDTCARATLALKKLHSDSQVFAKINELLAPGNKLDQTTRRALAIALNRFTANQLPEAILSQLSTLSAEIEQTFNTFRGRISEQEFTNNQLLDQLATSRDSTTRHQSWAALKQVGEAVGPRLIKLAILRNQGARKLGFADYWEMKIKLQEHDPQMLVDLFAELEQLTNDSFGEMKKEMDEELAQRFKLKPAELMPWHYDNPFFQAAPPAAAVDLDDFYRHLKKEDIPNLARKFMQGVGMPVEGILARSSLFEQPGKDQHAFCEDMDRNGDVRVLTNLQPTAEWMDTMLHELGHAVYDVYINHELPFNLRVAAHPLTTEGVAMLLGALAKNPAWIATFSGADKAKVKANSNAILEQRRREQLIFCRWTMVMFHFEKALYADPQQNLDKLWWDLVERFQFLKRPPGRDQADWAAKPHFTIAPVYYHNYMLGELFAAQLRATMAKMAGHAGPTSALKFNQRKDFGDYLKEKVFKPGKLLPWAKLVKTATQNPLSAKHFAAEVKH